MADKRKHDTEVCSRSIVLHINIPYTNLFDFLKAFGERFALMDLDMGAIVIEEVKGYGACLGTNYAYVDVCVSEFQEKEFYVWFDTFCKERQLSFSSPLKQRKTRAKKAY